MSSRAASSACNGPVAAQTRFRVRVRVRFRVRVRVWVKVRIRIRVRVRVRVMQWYSIMYRVGGRVATILGGAPGIDMHAYVSNCITRCRSVSLGVAQYR